MFTGLFIIALLLILVHKIDLGIISGLSKTILFITAPIIKVATLPADGISYAYKKSSEIMNVYEENERLKQENDALYLLQAKLDAAKAENNSLKQLLHHFDIPNIKSYTAYVIAENGNAYSNSFIIYIGKNKDKIKQGYAVVNEKGLIGRIDMVSDAYAKVSLITDINSKIPVVSSKTRERGILIGQNTQELNLIFTPLLAELKKGDLLVTSSIGGGLPPNIPVAKIKKVDVDKIIALPLFTPTQIEIVKIIAYDIAPSTETKEELR
jgi:rod shape-determining protein MreC